MDALPFASLFRALRQNGFTITPEQIAQCYQIALKYSKSPHEEYELCAYMAPIFARSENEQRIFNEIFYTEFKPATLKMVRPSIRHRFEKQGREHPIQAIAVYLLLAILIVRGIIFAYHSYDTIDADAIRVHYAYTDKNGLNKTGTQLQTSIGSTVSFTASVRYEGAASQRFSTEVTYDWGDGQRTSESNHVYRNTGNYDLTAIANVLYKGTFVKRTVSKFKVIICSTDVLILRASNANKPIRTGEDVQLQATVEQTTSFTPYNFQWIESGRYFKQGSSIRLSFSKAGTYNIQCIASTPNNPDCTLEKTIELQVLGDTPVVQQAPQGVTNNSSEPGAALPTSPAPQPPKDKLWLYLLYGALALIFTALAIQFFRLYEQAIRLRTGWKKNKPGMQLIDVPVAPRDPITIPFRGQQELVADTAALQALCKPLRNRLNEEVPVLHIAKTIRKSIQAGGLLQEVREVKTRPPAYLILLDANAGSPNLLHLFEYLIDIFKQQNLEIEKYYFQSDPSHCYNGNEPEGISFDKLGARYGKHVLLLLGDGHALLSSTQLNIDNNFLPTLQQWQYKAVVTPVCFNKWNSKEWTLLASVAVLPMDVTTVHLLPEVLFMNHDANLITSKLNNRGNKYHPGFTTDYNSIDQLEAYSASYGLQYIDQHGVSVNVLFEWLKALAVYPTIDWPVMIAIGKAVLDRYHLSHALNYSSLLHLVRIDWIRQGVLPDRVRLELLKRLSKENERIARTTILELLKEIPSIEIPVESSLYSEREMQRVVNEFNLYAHDPQTFSAYHASKQQFEHLWKQQQLTDAVTKTYLTNKDAEWDTLLRYGQQQQHVGADKYFEAVEIGETNLARTYLWLTLISVFVVVSSVFAILILYRWTMSDL